MAPDASDFTQRIDFASQQAPVLSGGETAALAGDVQVPRVEEPVPAQSSVTVQNVQQQLDLPAIQEQVAMDSFNPFVEDTRVRLRVDLDGDGTVDIVTQFSPRKGSVLTDPGVLAPEPAVIELELINDSTTDTTIGFQALFRDA
jgi:hypothetical protein